MNASGLNSQEGINFSQEKEGMLPARVEFDLPITPVNQPTDGQMLSQTKKSSALLVVSVVLLVVSVLVMISYFFGAMFLASRQ